MRVSERTCCICRSKGDKRSLVRLVMHEEKLVVDYDQRLPGRGGYVHLAIECLSKMGQPGRWERALRLKGASLEASQVSRVVLDLMTRVNPTVGVPEGDQPRRGSQKRVRL